MAGKVWGLRLREWLLLGVTGLAFASFTPLHGKINKLPGCAEYVAPDMNVGLSLDVYADAKKCLTCNLEAGLGYYLHWHTMRLDLVFPALLAFASTIVLVRIGERLPRFNRMGAAAKWSSGAALPVAYAVADYAENWNVARWLKSGDDGLLSLIQTLTTLKFAALAVAAIIAIGLFLSGLKQKGLS